MIPKLCLTVLIILCYAVALWLAKCFWASSSLILAFWAAAAWHMGNTLNETWNACFNPKQP